MQSQKFEFQNVTIKENNLDVYNARKYPFKLYGLYKPEEEWLFRRMPTRIANQVSEKVRALHTNTAGARLCFRTDSLYIAVGAVYSPAELTAPRTVILSGTGAYCFDLYADGKFCSVMWPDKMIRNGSTAYFDIENEKYEAFYDFDEKKTREITLYFPSFVNIESVYIGLQEGCALEESSGYSNEKPIVFYGSSITQGACASRVGNIYTNILSRKLNLDYVNLGFAGAAKAEDVMIDYLCYMEMCALILEYDHNAKNVEYLKQTHYLLVEKVRSAHPDIPIILMSRPNQSLGEEQTRLRVEVIKDSYRKRRNKGDLNIYFVSGQEIFSSQDANIMTIDGTHPTDFGHYCIAQRLQKELERTSVTDVDEKTGN